MEPTINHFDEFCKFIKEQTWMSKELGDTLIRKFMAAQSDAYTRGQHNCREVHEAAVAAVDQRPYESIAKLPKRIVARLRKLSKDPATFILCIKQIRELTGEGLRESKDFADKLRGYTKTSFRSPR